MLLVVGGFTCMGIAEKMAAAEGIELVNKQTDEENHVFTYEYGDDSIGRITLNIKDAEVNIIGGASDSYIELINFADGMYEFSSANNILSISNNSNLSSLNGIASMAMNFKGLRSLVSYYNISGRDKIVNVYISDECPVKIVSCELDTGAVTIEDGSTQTDYNIMLGEGDLTLRSIATTSVVGAEIGTGDILLDTCRISNFNAEIEKGSVEAIASDFMRIQATLHEGDFDLGYMYEASYVNLELSTGMGKIYIDGEDKNGFYEVTGVPSSTLFDITLGSGDITLHSNMKPTVDETAE